MHTLKDCFLSCAWVIVLLLATYPARAQDEIIVKEIAFQGNKSFANDVLQAQMTLKPKSFLKSIQFWNKDNRAHEYSENILTRDLRRIVSFYNTEGFLKTRIDTFFVNLNNDENKARINIHVTEGDSVVVRKFDFELNARDDFDRERCGKILRDLQDKYHLREGLRFRDAALQADTDLIYNHIANAGYPYVAIKPRPALNNAKNALELTLVVSPGPHCAFGDIEVEGNERVPASAVIKQLAFRKGEIFNQDAVRKSQAQIYQLGIFQFVTIQLLFQDSTSQVLPVRIKLREAPTYTTKFGLGYGREEKVRLSADSQILGLGGARRLNILAKRSALEPINLSATLTQPAFPDRYSVLTANPFYRHQKETAFDIVRIGTNLAVQRKMGTYTNGFINYTLENTEQKGANLENLPESNNKSAVSVGMVRNSSAPLFSPTEGSIRSATVTVSGFGFNSVRFVRVIGEHIKYWSLAESVVLAHKLKFGWLEALGTDTAVPKEERFYAGGSNSVRGWRRQELGPLGADGRPLGGNMLMDASIELRFPIYGLFSGVTFMDLGNVWNDQISGLHYAFGLGLRFETLIGPARIDFGIPTFEDGAILQRKKTQYHISIGHAF